MRKNSLMLIAAIVAVIALTISIPVFLSGCSDEDTASLDRTAQQVQERDGSRDKSGSGRDGRGMHRQGESQDVDCDGDCVGNGEGRSDAQGGDTECDGDCDGDCDVTSTGACEGYCDEASADGCDGDCVGTGVTDEEPFGSDPICL